MTDKSIVICAQILFLYDDKQAEIPYASNHLFEIWFSDSELDRESSLPLLT